MTTAQDGAFFYVLDEPARILLVDDDPILREFAVVHLSTDVASVTTAEDGVEGLEILQQNDFDILLVDLEMPRMDGFQLLERLRADERWRHTPVIVETGREDVVAIDRAFRLGATSFIVKPVNWRLLSYQIRFVLRAHRSEQALRRAREGLQAQMVRNARAADEVLKAGAGLLELAWRGDESMRGAARAFADRLKSLGEEAVEARAARTG